MGKIILITGGCGFIGSNLIKFLLKKTKYKIINVDKLTYAGNIKNLNKFKNHPRYFFVKKDIANFLEIKKIFFKFNPTHVIHLAAESHVDRSIESPDVFVRTNILGTFNLLKVATYYHKKKNLAQFRFHHVSTDEVYGDIDLKSSPADENFSYKPNSPYSASKASSDHFVKAWFKTYGLPIIISNCSNNYGPYQYPEKLIPHVILCAVNKKKIPLYGDGNQIRDWIHVDDHVRGILKALFNGKIGETYNIGGNNQITNKQLVHTICDILDKKNKFFKEHKKLIDYVVDRPGHDRRYSLSTNKIFKELNWQPKIKFKIGIKKTINWYLSNSKWCKALIKKYKLKRVGIINGR